MIPLVDLSPQYAQVCSSGLISKIWRAASTSASVGVTIGMIEFTNAFVMLDDRPMMFPGVGIWIKAIVLFPHYFNERRGGYRVMPGCTNCCTLEELLLGVKCEFGVAAAIVLPVQEPAPTITWKHLGCRLPAQAKSAGDTRQRGRC